MKRKKESSRGSSKMSEPNKTEIVSDLSEDDIRWTFLFSSKWMPLTSDDSQAVERKRSNELEGELSDGQTKVFVMDRTFEVVLDQTAPSGYGLQSVARPGDPKIPLQRSKWFQMSRDGYYIGIEPGRADFLENYHLKTFRDKAMPLKSEKLWHQAWQDDASRNQIQYKWYGSREVLIYDWSRRTKFQRLLRRRPAPFTAFRGYPVAKDVRVDVTNVVLAVHGVGQLVWGDLEETCREMTSICENLMKKYFVGKAPPRIIPIIWAVPSVERELPKKRRRNDVVGVVDDTVCELMEYLQQRIQIRLRLVDLLNMAVYAHLAQDPGFRGKITIVGHSLGSLMSADALTNGFKVDNSACEPGPSTTEKSHASLQFQVENCFMMGSPLGKFLACEFGRAHEALKSLLVGFELYNIIDADDPVAGKLEPLFAKEYAELPPLYIRRFSESPGCPYDTKIPILLSGIELKLEKEFDTGIQLPRRLDYTLRSGREKKRDQLMFLLTILYPKV